MADRVWNAALTYLRLVGHHEYRNATELLDDVVQDEGLGAVNDAIAAVCRSLLDRVTFAPGTIDVNAAVDALAHEIVAVAQRHGEDEIDRQRALIVYLGSEGLPCLARTQVASWAPMELLGTLVACMLGLVGIVSEREDTTLTDVVSSITPPRTPTAALGTFGLAWRGEHGAEPFAGAIPKGYAPHITFLGDGTCSLRELFARVAYLRDERQVVTVPTTPQSLQST